MALGSDQYKKKCRGWGWGLEIGGFLDGGLKLSTRGCRWEVTPGGLPKMLVTTNQRCPKIS